MWQAQKRTGDYHGELAKNVNKLKWHELFEDACKRLKEQGYQGDFKLDNAKYHKEPVPGALTRSKVRRFKLADLRQWLDEEGVRYPTDWLKPRLLQEVLERLPDPKYLAEELEIAEKYGHEVHWTPQYHPELQPIEVIWAWCKNYVRKHNKEKNMERMGELISSPLTAYYAGC